MQLENSPKKDYANYIRLAETGHYPLFFEDWLQESLSEKQNLNFRNASKNVKNIFNELARHRTLEKKRTALLGMDRLTREEFVRSFFKVVEHEVLKGLKTLQ
jgi:hypothetical protein